MSETGHCICGAVGLTVPALPDHATDCNCSICGRIGALWGYLPADAVTVEGRTEVWQRSAEPLLSFHHCPVCASLTHWTGLRPPAQGRIGVNLRMFDAFDPWTVTPHRVDGAHDNWPT